MRQSIVDNAVTYELVFEMVNTGSSSMMFSAYLQRCRERIEVNEGMFHFALRNSNTKREGIRGGEGGGEVEVEEGGGKVAPQNIHTSVLFC